jgi:cytochrome P450
MRQSHPVLFDPGFQSWSVFRYKDALQVLTNPRLYSSEAILPFQPHLPSILGMDDPRHYKLRSIVSKAFTPRFVEQLAPRVEAITHELIDRVIERGEMDAISEFAYPIPLTIIAHLLGVPAEDQEMFKRWSDAISGPPRQTPQGNYQELEEYFRQKLAERRLHPVDDLMSRLITAEVDGEHLSEEELLEFCRLLLIAGYETTANLLGNTFICFDQYPHVAEELSNEPALIPGAIEEILRYFPSVSGVLRIANEDTVLGGQHIARHQAVMIWIASVNRDEEQFPEPERFDIRREPNRHLAFGHGIHFCLGAPLARLEAKIALPILLQCLSEIRRDPTKSVEAVKSPMIIGVKQFHVTFKPRSK